MAKLKNNQFLLNGHIITEIPLLFQTDMVQAVQEDRKTQTRRTRGLDYLNNPNYFKEFDGFSHVVSLDGKERFGILLNLKRDPDMGVFVKYPYGKPGDLLWVRENWTKIEAKYYYQAEGAENELCEEYGLDKVRWKPSIHMPKTAARIWLMVDEIRVERLQDTSEEDAVAEGVRSCKKANNPGIAYFDYSGKIGAQGFNFNSAQESFKTLWISINGLDSWNQNPWVWVVKFQVLSKTGKPSEETIWYAWDGIVKKEVTNV